MKQFNVALVGCGTISFNHLTAISKLPSIKVVALCDVKPERAEARKREFGLDAAIYTDYYEMLKNEKLDAVHITTPHYLHAPMTLAALKRDIYVCLEKPMCISTDEITNLIEAEKKSRAGVAVSFQTRYNKANVIAKRIAEEDGIVSAYFSLFWQRTDEYYTESGWRGAYATEGGGVMINQAIHSLDHLITLCGKPVAVTATTANHKHKGIIEVEDTCEGMVEFENGIVGNFFATNAFRGTSRTSIFIKTNKHELEIRNSKLYIDDKLVEDTEGAGHLGKEVYGEGHLTFIEKFYEAIENGSEMPITLESAQWPLRLLLAAYKSNDKRVLV
jgi:predicted dehydrogenase